MKLFNFRPCCWLALIVMVAAGSCLVSLWLALTLAVVLAVVLTFLKLPNAFKITAIILYVMTILSFVLTTAVVPNPEWHTYDPNAGLRGVILRYAHWYLNLFLSSEHANLLYAMMFGDKSGLPYVLKFDFSVAGLAHMLAVSGLHVMLLAGVITTILRWCRVPKRLRFWVVVPLLLFYAYLCGWQYAVLRATIMCLVYGVAQNYLHVADGLSVLGLAAVVILILFPYAIVSASFWLSFSCVFGINLFYAPIHKVIPVATVAMYLAITIGSFPFMVYYFGYLPLLALISNVILVPALILAFYVGMFAVSTFVLGALLYVVSPLLSMVTTISAVIAAIPFSTFLVDGPAWGIAFYLLGLIIISRFVFLRPRVKYPLAVALFTCYFVLLVV